MKTIKFYCVVACSILLCVSCNNGRWECQIKESKEVVCINNTDTVTYYVQTLLQQNVEAKEYYESNGYVCIESPYNNGAPTTWVKGRFKKREIKELEKMGYDCLSIGP